MLHFINTFPDRKGNKAKIYYDDSTGEYIVKFFNSQNIHMDGSDFRSKSKAKAFEHATPKEVVE